MVLWACTGQNGAETRTLLSCDPFSIRCTIKTLNPAGIILIRHLDLSDIHVLQTQIIHYLVGLTSETIAVTLEKRYRTLTAMSSVN